VSKLHLTSYLNGKSNLNLSVAGGVLGAGKVVLSLGVATISVVALTIYFLIALPGVKRLWLSLIPLSRRQRVGLLTDEVFDRVGGFMLGSSSPSWWLCSILSPWSARRSPGLWSRWWHLRRASPLASPRASSTSSTASSRTTC
jgi:hypothetical protein